MIVKKLMLTSIFLFAVGLVCAQFDLAYNSNNEVFTENRYARVEGDPFLLSEWSPGKIYAMDGQVITHPRVNFNGDNGQVEVKEEEGKIISLNALLYNRVEIESDGATLVFVNRQLVDRSR